ncbi:MAG: FAD binding domain-containing protein [Desulfobacterales bacterium]|nr:FAD binding domain-containing protein [Desulfobacterales bacterium]
MSLPEFNYLSPPDLKAVCDLLREFKGQIALCAGGTELVMHLKHRLKSPGYLLSLKNLPDLKTLRFDPEAGLILGAMCALKDLSADTRVKSRWTALAQGAEQVASPQVRNRATIGGNVCLDTRCWYYNRSKQWRSTFPVCFKARGDQCHVVKGGRQCYALFQADTVPGLMILKAKLKIVHSDGERMIPVEAFYSGLGETPNLLSDQEVLTEIHVPPLPPRSGTSYVKYKQRSVLEFPLLGVASRVTLDGEGKYCREAGFGIIGHSSKPLLIEAGETLNGLDEPVLTDDILEHLLREVKPVKHMGVTASLKRRMARVFVQNAFSEAWKQARSQRADIIQEES